MQETKPKNKALTSCSDTPIPLPEVCSKFPPTAAHSYNLCVGLKKILSAPCSALYNHTFLESAIATVGVVPDTREERLYGESAKHMVKGLYGSQHYKPNVGLWQEPQQLAAALIAAAKHLKDVTRYVEVGFYTAWSTCVIAAYFNRLCSGSGGDCFRGVAVDVTTMYAGGSTRVLLSSLNVEVVILKSGEKIDAKRAAMKPRTAGEWW